jgi:hypothetical protein
MHSRRFACLVLGAWLMGSVLMAVVATQNFRRVDRLLERPVPAAVKLVEDLGADGARSLLRYHASELNRFYFTTWETIQLGLGVGLFFILLFGSPEGKLSLGLAMLMLLLVALMRFALTPEIVVLGRLIDFVPADPPTPERHRFWVLHSAYSSLEVLKFLLGLALAVRLARRHRRRAFDRARDIDPLENLARRRPADSQTR